MATITFKVQQKSSKIKSDKIDQLLADLGCIVGIVSAIQSGVIIKQFVFSNIEGGIAHPICHTLTKSLGTVIAPEVLSHLEPQRIPSDLKPFLSCCLLSNILFASSNIFSLFIIPSYRSLFITSA